MTLLNDALDRTMREPHCAKRWQNLLALWLGSSDQTAREAALEAIGNLSDIDARSDILRLTFLAEASGKVHFENAAAARALAVRPVDPDRLAAFMAFRWLNALQHLESRPEFIADLTAGLLPEMARVLMQQALGFLPAELVPRLPQEIQRVAVVVPYVGHQFHTPSIMAVEQCTALAREGRQVHIFSAQELMPTDAVLFRGDGRDLMLPPFSPHVWANLLPAGVSMTVSDSRFSLAGRWRKLMPALAGFDPDVVLLVGLYSPLAAALFSVRPAIGISVNTVAPIAPLDVWLTSAPPKERGTEWGRLFPAPEAIFHPYRVRRSRQQFAVTRESLSLPDSAVVMITVGFRLEHEIRSDWAQRMLQVMASYPETIWLLAGGAGRLPKALARAPAGRVRVLATRDDIPGILRISDIYVNPPRMGGGISVAEAMAEGLPVIALAGSDGGDKAGEAALPNQDAYVERLAALIGDPTLRKRMGVEMRRRFDERFDLEAAGPALIAACKLAAELAGARLKDSS
ncbi:MAG: glycosyltransferase family 4 protein [Sulfuritalea sp.]|nr:glycosyltransferase family 4 protein [Sulfuritalea sp.]